MGEIPKFRAVALDTDGLTADTSETAIVLTKRYLKRYCENPNLNFKKEDVDCWDFLEKKLIENGFTQDKANELSSRIWNSHWVLKNAKPVPGAVELVKYLYDETEVDVYSHTSRPIINGIKQITENWIDSNLVLVAETLTNPKESGLKGVIFKATNAIKLAHKYGSVLVFDDFPGHVFEMADYVEKYMAETGQQLDIHFVLMPYAKISVPDRVSSHKMVTVVGRDSEGSVRTAISRIKDSVAQY